MKLCFEENEQATTVRIAGRIDTETAGQLGDRLAEVSSDEKLILDFEAVDYITSAGLRVLLIEQKKHSKSGLEVVNVSECVQEVFDITGFSDIIDVHLAKMKEADLRKVSLRDFLKVKTREGADHIAFTISDGVTSDKVSYAQLDLYSSIIARELRAKGVKRGTHVGMMGANSANWVYTFFAIQKLGAISFLINFNLNEQEVGKIISVSDITHLCIGDVTAIHDRELFGERLMQQEKQLIKNVYFFDSNIDFAEKIGRYDDAEYEFSSYVDYDDTAVVIFTSGSTGNPKAVMLSAYNLLNASKTTLEILEIDKRDISLQVLPMFHIFGLCVGLIGNLLMDIPIVIPKTIRTAMLLDVIQKEACTVLYSIPTLLLAIQAGKTFSSDKVDTLRVITFGGAGVTLTQMKELQKNFRKATFCSMYGQSELTPATVTPFGDTFEHVALTIGKAIPTVQTKITDVETGATCEAGQSGELCLKGTSTMVGYYHVDPLDQPFDDAGWLHTGDLAVMDEEGYITLVGRAKEMIKKGGENIAPAEVAEEVSNYPGVEDVKVVGIQDDFYNEVVGVALVMKEGMPLDKGQMLCELRKHLAKYKVPSYIFEFDQFPTLASGKVDAVKIKKIMNRMAKENSQERLD